MIRPQYVTALGRELGVDKQDVDNALEMNFSGSRAGLYREGSDLLPVVVRPPESERLDANHLNNVPGSEPDPAAAYSAEQRRQRLRAGVGRSADPAP